MQAEQFQRRFLLGLVIAISLLFFWMIKDFLITLLLAAIFSSLLRPLYLRFQRWTNNKPKLSSALSLLVFFLLIIVPAFGFIGVVANQAVSVTQDVTPWVQDHLGNKEELTNNLEKLPGYSYVAPYSGQIIGRVGEAVSGLGNFIFKGASAFTAGTLIFFLHFAIMLYAMFFFFIDGPHILEKTLYYMPLKSRDEKKLLDGFRSMARATLKGLFIIGVLQGLLAGLALWIAGIPSPLFWTTIMAVLSMVPNVGSALVWIPACIYLFIKGQTVAGVCVFLWCALVVGTVDNILRPVLVGKDTQVHELLVFISTLGGLAAFGLVGFLLGPVLALLFLTIWDIYGHTFKDVLPKPGEI